MDKAISKEECIECGKKLTVEEIETHNDTCHRCYYEWYVTKHPKHPDEENL